MNKENIFNIVKEIITKEDPIGLLEIGAPDDEYNLEVGEISYRIVQSDGKNISEIIVEVFKEKFNEDTVINCKARLNKVAEDIKEAIDNGVSHHL